MAARLLIVLSLFALLSASTLNGAGSEAQHPLLSSDLKDPEARDIVHELRRAEIIPTVLPISFAPLAHLNATWSEHHQHNSNNSLSAQLGNILPPKALRYAPHGIGVTAFNSTRIPATHWPYNVILALTDPDAPSRINPEWNQVCHWLVHYYVPPPSSEPAAASVDHSDDVDDDSDCYSLGVGTDFAHTGGTIPSTRKTKRKARELVEYKPPGPPLKTGAHRYVLVALTAVNKTGERLQLQAPSERKRWGFKHERVGVGEWAEQEGLEAIAANFFYAQNSEQ